MESCVLKEALSNRKKKKQLSIKDAKESRFPPSPGARWNGIEARSASPRAVVPQEAKGLSTKLVRVRLGDVIGLCGDGPLSMEPAGARVRTHLKKLPSPRIPKVESWKEVTTPAIQEGTRQSLS